MAGNGCHSPPPVGDRGQIYGELSCVGPRVSSASAEFFLLPAHSPNLSTFSVHRREGILGSPPAGPETRREALLATLAYATEGAIYTDRRPHLSYTRLGRRIRIPV